MGVRTELVTLFPDKSTYQVIYHEKGWGPFRHIEVEIIYDSPEESHTLKKDFRNMDYAEEWSYDRMLEFRMNG